MYISFKTNPIIEKLYTIILKTGDPINIYLFGSYARGDQKENSDIDIFILEESLLPKYKRAIKYRIALSSLGVPKDIIVRTPKEFESNKKILNSLENVIEREGILLYEKKS